MLRLSAWQWVGVCAAVVILAVTIAAAVDHELKIRALRRASVSEYYCAHVGTHCDEEKSHAIENAWSSRERVYKGAGVLFAAVGAIAVIAVRRRER